jgi:maleylacetate reductase
VTEGVSSEPARPTVRWSLAELPGLLDELGLARPFLVASARWDGLALPHVGRWTEVPSDRIEVPPEADSLLAVGGGSAIDTAKDASAKTGLPVISVPTTYSGAEWTPAFGVRSPDRHMVGGGSGAHLAAIVYDVGLTLDLPRPETVGTALNALAHCAEALYVQGRNDEGDACALGGAALIAETLPRVVAEPRDRAVRGELLRGAANAGEALALAGLGLGHAIAQALGGRYGLPHGAMNALALPAAIRFNTPLAPEAVARFGAAIGAPEDPAGMVEALARLGGFERLSDFGVPGEDMPAVAEAAAARGGNQNNPRPATPAEIERLLHQIYR